MTAELQPIDAALLNRSLRPRARDSHKGDFGHVLIVGGGPGMPGAVRLCGEACLRSGAGLVTVATRPENLLAVVAGRPELMCHGVQDMDALQPLLDAADIVVVGPGLGRDAWAEALFAGVLATDKTQVIDADGLNLLARQRGPVSRAQTRVLTPHPGEAARLLGIDIAQVQADRCQALDRLVESYEGIFVLKGAGTLVGTRGHLPERCDHGNPGMASAGMGDVLTGVVAAMLAQIEDPWDAVRVAVLAHALAGDAAAQSGERGLIASDVMARLPACLNPQSN
jgi:NAD(P)H-hydrate epimerase